VSAQQLNFYHPQCDSVIVISKVQDRVMLNIKQGLSIDVDFSLDRSQAHMLKLWLEEHLK
jgi:hypothetical protein